MSEIERNELEISAWPADPGGMRVYQPRGVRIVHKPTGIAVECTHERSMHANRDAALRAITAALATQQPQGVPEAMRSVASEMREYLDQEVEPGFDVIEQWAATLADAAPSPERQG